MTTNSILIVKSINVNTLVLYHLEILSNYFVLNVDDLIIYFKIDSIKENITAFASDGHRLIPSASDIGIWARFAEESAIGSCTPLASPFVVGT